MKFKRKYSGKVINNKLVLHDKQSLTNAIKKLNGKYVWLTLEVAYRQRTTQQNRYYWGVVIPELCEFFGYSADEMHEALKWKFLRVVRDGLPDTVRSTTELSTIEFNEYIAGISEWAFADYDIVIPTPDDVELPEHFYASE